MELGYRVSRVAFAARLFAFTLSLVAVGAPLAADPIPIAVMGGFIEIEGRPFGDTSIGAIQLRGLGAFEMRAGGSALVPSCTICEPGTRVRLGGRVDADAGTTTFRGVTTEFDNQLGPFGGELSIDARTALLPPSGPDGIFTVRTWFTLDPSNSTVRLPDRPDPGNPGGFLPGHVFEFSGRGTGALSFRLDSENGSASYLFESARFDFTPVPEPGSLMLLGGGLTLAWMRRRASARR